MTNKRRMENFSQEEKVLLVDIISEFAAIIENKITDAIGWSQKNEAWEKVASKFNFIKKRNIDKEKLRNAWGNIKQQTRKYYFNLKQEIYKTGGGKNNTQPNILYDKAHALIQLSVDGLYNSNDGDNVIPLNDNNNNLSNLSLVDEIIEEEENDDPNNDHVFEYLIKNSKINSWEKWNSKKLKTSLSKPLAHKINNQQASNSKNTKYSSITSTKNVNTMQNILTKSKIELTNLMIKELKEKGDLERQVLQEQLLQEILKVKLLKAEYSEKVKNIACSIDISDTSD